MAQLETRRVGELDCHVITTVTDPELVAVFCHGFGAPGDDLVAIGAQLLQSCPKLLDKVQIVFPSALLTMEAYGLPTGRAWWHLDMDRLTRAAQLGTFRDLRQDVPEGLTRAHDLLRGLIEALREETGLPMHRFILGGFSQGSMLATDVALHLEEKPGGLVLWSGTLIKEDDWRQQATILAGLPVVQSHGREDPILPFEAALWLRDLLTGGGADVEFIEFSGPHTIPFSALEAAGRLLERQLEPLTE